MGRRSKNRGSNRPSTSALPYSLSAEYLRRDPPPSFQIPQKNDRLVKSLNELVEKLYESNVHMRARMFANKLITAEELNSIEDLLLQQKLQNRKWSQTVIDCMEERDVITRKINFYKIVDDKIKKKLPVPNNIDRELKIFEPSFNGRKMDLYDPAVVAKYKTNVKELDSEYQKDLLQLKMGFEESSLSVVSAKIEDVKKEITEKFSSQDANFFIGECTVQFFKYKKDSANNQRFFENFVFG